MRTWSKLPIKDRTYNDVQAQDDDGEDEEEEEEDDEDEVMLFGDGLSSGYDDAGAQVQTLMQTFFTYLLTYLLTYLFHGWKTRHLK